MQTENKLKNFRHTGFIDTNKDYYKYGVLFLKQLQMFSVDLQSGRIGADEVIDDTEGKGAEELEERLKEKEAKTHAILLEMVRQTSALSPLLQTTDPV